MGVGEIFTELSLLFYRLFLIGSRLRFPAKPIAIKAIILFFASVLLTIIASGTRSWAGGEVYYVASSGRDSNPGTDIAPFRTIEKGAAALKPGDTLYVRAGTYIEALHGIPGGTSWNNPVTVAAAPGHSVTLRAPVGSAQVISFAGPTQRYIIIDGLVIDGSDAQEQVVRIAQDHIRMQNSEIRNLSRRGVGIRVVAGDSTGAMGCCNEFINLNLHDDRADPPTTETAGLLIGSAHNLVDRSEIHSTWGDGIVLLSENFSSAHNNIIRNNRIFDNGKSGSGEALAIAQGIGNLVYNNIVFGNSAGISVAHQASGTKVYNNTVYGNSTFGVYIEPANSDGFGTAVINNILYQNGTNIEEPKTAALLLNNLETDPSFVDPANEDFRLQATSAAIDAGVALAEVQDDRGGVPRPQGATYDVGAYELVGSFIPSAELQKSTAANSASTATTRATSATDTFDFSLTNNGDRSVVRGQSATNEITATLNSEPSQAVSFSVSGLPKGATASFSATHCEPFCSTQLTITTPASARKGKHRVTVTGSAAGTVRTTRFILAVYTATDGVLALGWLDNSSNEAGFYIERKNGTDGIFVRIRKAGRNRTSYSDKKLTVGAEYCYRVRAYNRRGTSPYSNEACGTAGLP